jgi:hypothetical protein
MTQRPLDETDLKILALLDEIGEMLDYLTLKQKEKQESKNPNHDRYMQELYSTDDSHRNYQPYKLS